jgi:hypothetical protein
MDRVPDEGGLQWDACHLVQKSTPSLVAANMTATNQTTAEDDADVSVEEASAIGILAIIGVLGCVVLLARRR